MRTIRIALGMMLLFAFWTGAAYCQEPPVTAVAFAPDGKQVVTISQAGIRILSWPQLESVRLLKAAASNLHCLAFSPDGKHLAVGGGEPTESGSVEIFTWPDAQSVTRKTGHEDSVRAVQWVSASQLISAGIDRQIKLWNMSGPESTHSFSGHSRGVDTVCVMKNSQLLVSAGVDQSLRVWQLSSAKLARRLNQHTRPIHDLALRPTEDGLPMVASAAEDRTIRFWQPTIGRMVRYVRLESVPLNIEWQDQDRIVAACVDGQIRVVNANEVKVLATLTALEGWAYALAVHPSDNSLIVGGSHGQLKRITLD